MTFLRVFPVFLVMHCDFKELWQFIEKILILSICNFSVVTSTKLLENSKIKAAKITVIIYIR